MGTRLCNIVVDSADVTALSGFWSALLALPAVPADSGEVDLTVTPELDVVFVPVSEPKAVKNRVHLDLASASPQDQAAIVARARELGARPVDIGQGEMPWVVLADPEGNEFCVLEPREEYAATGPVAAVVLDAADPRGLAAFWAEATGMPVVRAHEEFASLRPTSGPYLELVKVPDAKTVKNRVHLDVAPHADGRTEDEVRRLEALGARRVDLGQGDVPWVVLADIEGNEFCVLTPR
ncbi:VOC family protein [Saccharothrix coeruleofusca]|uniref:Glyoxalase-like domain-containing protein n=1 Tax=Saccharothrix coeruleofusca TaxID=33919 RepID=A0A918EBD3_9PSEU|nr:VOC family protein [Saccharothrix coeruleofusca]GGP41116.1 hypothetical protein GCM10010185_10260 [Saccharothrix coeruleofusca]